MPRLKSHCIVCGAETLKQRKYCPDHQAESTRARAKPWRRKFGDFNCAHCGKLVQVPPNERRRYCSYACHIASGGAIRAGLAARQAKMRYGAKKDANHQAICTCLDQMKVGYWDLSDVGRGIPDLLVYCGGQYHPWEIKNPRTTYGRRGLNKNQKALEARTAPINIIRTIDEAIAFINLHRRPDDLGQRPVKVWRSEQDVLDYVAGLPAR